MPTTSDQRHLRPTPALELPLRFPGLEPGPELLAPEQGDRQSAGRETLDRAREMLPDSKFEIAGVAGVRCASPAMEHVGPKRHSAEER
jgi:hypothetical protein